MVIACYCPKIRNNSVKRKFIFRRYGRHDISLRNGCLSGFRFFWFPAARPTASCGVGVLKRALYSVYLQNFRIPDTYKNPRIYILISCPCLSICKGRAERWKPAVSRRPVNREGKIMAGVSCWRRMRDRRICPSGVSFRPAVAMPAVW